MLKISPILSKTIVGLTASIILIPVMSNSASAASLKIISEVIGIAEQNTNNIYADCTSSPSGWTVTLSCDQRYKAKSVGAHTSQAGRASWRFIYQNFQFTGDRGRRYRVEYSLQGKISSSVALVAGLGRANAFSGLGAITANPFIDVILSTKHPKSLSDWDELFLTTFKTFDFNGGSTQKFSVGAQTLGFAEAIVLGALAEAKANISFKSIVKIKDIGRSRSSLGSFASVASASEDDFSPASDDGFSFVSEDDFSNISDDGFSFVSEDDFSNISDDGIVTSVPEPSQIGGLAALLAMLLATKSLHLAKKHLKETKKLVGTYNG